jgi:phage tail sheath gpL-like
MVTFSQVPASTRVPFVFIEIDPSRASSGPTIQEYRAVLLGQKLPATPQSPNVPFLATSSDQVGQAFGFGSVLHGMALAFFRANNVTETWFVGIDDAGGAIKATKTITVTGAATASGSVFLYIAGRRIVVPVASGDSQTAIATAINAAIQASEFATQLPVTSAVATNVVTLTARNGGTLGNAIDVRTNFQTGESLPGGFTVVVAAGVAGATDPTLGTALASLGARQYHVLGVGLNDATSIAAVDAELAARFGPSTQLEGSAFYTRTDTHANLVTFGSALNSKHTTVVGLKLPLSPSWEVTGSVAGVVSRFGQADPARPFKTLELVGIVGPALADRFTLQERDILLKNGIATALVDDSGVARVERLITTSQTNATGAKDVAFLDVNTLLTLSYLRFDSRTRFASTFPRHKLADDGTRYGPGQPIMTPKIGKAFFVSLFRSWEQLGLVEGFEQFQRDLVVERSVTDRNRLDVLLPPDLVNQLQVTGVSLQFVL